MIILIKTCAKSKHKFILFHFFRIVASRFFTQLCITLVKFLMKQPRIFIHTSIPLINQIHHNLHHHVLLFGLAFCNHQG